MENDCFATPIRFDLDEIGKVLTGWSFPFERDPERISLTLPGKNGDINFHMSIIRDGDDKACMLRLLSYSPTWSPLKEGLDGHAILHYLNHRNSAAILGRHFMDEGTGKVAFEITVYSSYGVFESDLQDLMWFTVNESDETVSHLKEMAKLPTDVH